MLNFFRPIICFFGMAIAKSLLFKNTIFFVENCGKNFDHFTLFSVGVDMGVKIVFERA